MSKNLEHDLQIQRLIDGELSRPEVQQLLRTANSQPELWRELAVAFVEDRIFASESRRFSQDEGRDLEPASSPAATPLAAGGMPGSMAKPTSAWRNTGLWLSAAAMMLCAAGLGFFAGRGQAGSQVSSETNLLANSNGGNATNQVGQAACLGLQRCQASSPTTRSAYRVRSWLGQLPTPWWMVWLVCTCVHATRACQPFASRGEAGFCQPAVS